MTFPKFLSGAFKVLLASLVIAFMGIHSYNFFTFTFSDKLQYFAWLGFGLTSVAVIGYLVIFKVGDGSDVQNGIAFIMMIVSLVGEVFTAGFGMQIESMGNAGIVLTKQEFQIMVYFVQGLGLTHGIALVLYFTFDQIVELWPSGGTATNKNRQHKVVASDTKQVKLDGPKNP